MTTCTICGKENPAGAEYCEDCGAALAPAAGLAEPPTTAVPEAQGGAAPIDGGQSVGGEGAVAPDDAGQSPGEGAAAPAAGATAPGVEEGAASAPLTNPRLAAKRYGAVTSEEIPLQGERLVVGRFDPESGPVDIDLSGSPEAGQLSRHHAELYREADGRWHVRDLGSTNGVFVKRPDSSTFGPRITAPVALSPGDEVAFGNARFIFRAD